MRGVPFIVALVATTVDGAGKGVWFGAGIVAIVTGLYVIRDRRATIYKDERDAEREKNKDLEKQAEILALKAGELERTRSLEPLLKLMQTTAETQSATLDKLGTFNGTLDALKVGLEEATEGMKTMTGLFAEANGLAPPLHTPRSQLKKQGGS